MIPTRIGPFEVKEEIGSGGMGAVFKAYDYRLDRWVAIKTVLPSKALSDERRARLRREARAVAGLNHRAIAQVYDIITEGRRDHIVMELVEGETLADLLDRGPIEPEKAVNIASQVAAGLAAAHEHRIIHRDLKAQNIMIGPKTTVKILDFGLAKIVEKPTDDHTLTNEGVVLGTCRAMSPEQAEGRGMDFRSDLFALGSLLYEMVTGVHPFARERPLDTLHSIVYDRPNPMEETTADIPEDLGFLIARLLEKKPSNRPQSALEVATALEIIARTWDTLTKAQTTVGLPSQRRRRRKRLVAICGAAVVLLGLAAAVVWFVSRPGPPLVVAVLRPTISKDADVLRAPIVGTSVHMEILNAIANTKGLAAPDVSETDVVQGPPSEVARAVAADEALVVNIDDCRMTCRITLRRLDQKGRMLWSDSILDVPAEDLQLIGSAVLTTLRKAYPKLGLAESGVSQASPDDLEAYLRVRHQLDHPATGMTRPMALEALAKIRQRSPRLLEAHLSEANTARYLYQASAETSYLEQARQAIARARNQAPHDPRGLLIAFDIALAAGDLDECDKLVDDLQRLDPANSDILGRRARLEQRRGESQHAVELLLRLVMLRPSWRNLHQLADAELQDGRVTEARDHLEEGLERAPENRFLLSKLGFLELTSGDPSRAADLYKALADNFGGAGYLSNFGLANLLARRYEEAAEASMKAHRMSPENPSLLLNLADSVALSGRAEEAREWYRLALDAAERLEDQQSATALGIKAQCLAHLGKDLEAATAAQAAVLAAPEDMEAHFAAALTYSVIGDTRSAVVCAGRSTDLGMNSRWFSMPWFDPLRGSAAFLALLEEADSAFPATATDR